MKNFFFPHTLTIFIYRKMFMSIILGDPKQLIETFVSEVHHNAYLFDFDGTLVDLVPDPDQIIVPPDLLHNLEKIVSHPKITFAIITGRKISKIDSFLPGVCPTIVGAHGTELRIAGQKEIHFLAPEMPSEIRDEVGKFCRQNSFIFEDKKFNLSFHLPFKRTDENWEPEIKKILAKSAKNYDIRKVGRTYEILSKSSNKGSGILHLMQQPAYKSKKPVYLGDDATLDESLKVVDTLNGLQVPARHIHHQREDRISGFWETCDIRNFVAALAQAPRI